VRSAKAAKRAADLRPVIETFRTAGITSAKGIGKALNESGIAAPRGGQWRTTQVTRLLQLMPTS
jgi:hypothetical protein